VPRVSVSALVVTVETLLESNFVQTVTPSHLVDLLPRPAGRNSLLAWNAVVIAVAVLFTAACAQVSIPLGFTPVPLTLQTFAVLLSGAVLGPRRGAASQAAYWAVGALGAPFYSAGEGGWDAATGATAGYLAGFVVAAFVAGWMSERGNDRNFVTSLSTMVFASAVIYACGAVWLSWSLGIPVANGERNAIALGVAPFLPGDALKIVAASAVAPGLWALAYSGTARNRPK